MFSTGKHLKRRGLPDAATRIGRCTKMERIGKTQMGNVDTGPTPSALSRLGNDLLPELRPSGGLCFNSF